jgi:hypothetical protein
LCFTASESVSSVLLCFTASQYPFGIFKLYFHIIKCWY